MASNEETVSRLHGTPDVAFDFGVSARLKETFTAAAAQLTAQRGERAGFRRAASTDFTGYFATEFTANGTTQLSDLDEIVTDLRSVVTQIAQLEDAARAENNRRKAARE